MAPICVGVTSREVVGVFLKQLWLKFVPVFHGLQGGSALKNRLRELLIIEQYISMKPTKGPHIQRCASQFKPVIAYFFVRIFGRLSGREQTIKLVSYVALALRLANKRRKQTLATV